MASVQDKVIEKAFGDGDTSLPDGLTRPAHWGIWEDAIEQWRAFREGDRSLSEFDCVYSGCPPAKQKKETWIKSVSP